MKVLILLSTYNGEKYLHEQMDSLLKQEGVDVSVLVRDDGSKDKTVTILKEYEAKHHNVEVEYGHNVGCADCFRWLLNAAYNRIRDYDYFAFSDQDDVWLPEKVKVACSILSKTDSTKPSMYCSNVCAVDSELNKINMKWKPNETLLSKEQSLVWSMSYGCTMLFNRKVIELFHSCPPEKLVLHDLWVMHMCFFFGDVYYDNHSYILYRQHGDNVVGAKTTFISRMRCHWKSLQHLFSQHYNEQEAQVMLKAYDGMLTPEDKALVGIVANYRKDFSIRIKWLFGLGKNYRAISRKQDNIWLKMRILLGKV